MQTEEGKQNLQPHFVGGEWVASKGSMMRSSNPYQDEVIWMAPEASEVTVDEAFEAAQQAFTNWSLTSFDERCRYVDAFKRKLEENKETLAYAIGLETGKPLWESRTEVAAMIGKIAISVKAYGDRTGKTVLSTSEMEGGPEGTVLRSSTEFTHHPLGVLAVLGPYNFPGHLPNGHIVPALLAGNTIAFKPSEYTPRVAEIMVSLWQETGLPAGVINLIQGGRDVGLLLTQNTKLNGVLFTGSAATGIAIHQQFAGRPEVMLALEMGGNNPLIIGNAINQSAAIHDTLFSAFVSAGQRCTCARRLFVPKNDIGDSFIHNLVNAAKNLEVGAFNQESQPFMGCVISELAANQLREAYQKLSKEGAVDLLPLRDSPESNAALYPGIVDVTHLSSVPDEEHFGPLLKVIRYDDFDDAICMANDTRYGLSAGLLSEDESEYQHFRKAIKAGILNWNKPITGASSAMPFGGVGISGNHRPSAYYAADYCAYPVASMLSNHQALPETLSPGMNFRLE